MDAATTRERAKKVAAASEATKRPGRQVDVVVECQRWREWMRFEMGRVIEYVRKDKSDGKYSREVDA